MLSIPLRKKNCIRETRAAVGLSQFTHSFLHHEVTNIPTCPTYSLYKSTGCFTYISLHENQNGLQLLVTTADIHLITIWPSGGQVI